MAKALVGALSIGWAFLPLFAQPPAPVSEARAVLDAQMKSPPRAGGQLSREENEIIRQNNLKKMGAKAEPSPSNCGTNMDCLLRRKYDLLGRMSPEHSAKMLGDNTPPDTVVTDVHGNTFHRSGDGFVGNDGVFYVPAGPDGVINTRTGQFIPIVR